MCKSHVTYLFVGYDTEDEQRHIHAIVAYNKHATINLDKTYLCGKKVSKDSLPFECELIYIEKWKWPMKAFPDTMCSDCEKILEERYPTK